MCGGSLKSAAKKPRLSADDPPSSDPNCGEPGFAEAWTKYASMPIPALKEFLDVNRQVKTGAREAAARSCALRMRAVVARGALSGRGPVGGRRACAGPKPELVSLCVDGDLHGALPDCPMCEKGRLRRCEKEAGSFECRGHYSETLSAWVNVRALRGALGRGRAARARPRRAALSLACAPTRRPAPRAVRVQSAERAAALAAAPVATAPRGQARERGRRRGRRGQGRGEGRGEARRVRVRRARPPRRRRAPRRARARAGAQPAGRRAVRADRGGHGASGHHP